MRKYVLGFKAIKPGTMFNDVFGASNKAYMQKYRAMEYNHPDKTLCLTLFYTCALMSLLALNVDFLLVIHKYHLSPVWFIIKCLIGDKMLVCLLLVCLFGWHSVCAYRFEQLTQFLKKDDRSKFNLCFLLYLVVLLLILWWCLNYRISECRLHEIYMVSDAERW